MQEPFRTLFFVIVIVSVTAVVATFFLAPWACAVDAARSGKSKSEEARRARRNAGEIIKSGENEASIGVADSGVNLNRE